MTASKRILRTRWLAVVLMALLLVALSAQTGVTKVAPPGQAYGDIPLDPATYQQHLKVLSGTELRDLPAAYDARNDGIVTPPKNQQSCGGCWAFASAGAMESHLLDAGLLFDPTDLSEQQQMSCNAGMSGCCGGSMTSLQYWETLGPVYETCFPWADGGTSCPPNSNVPCNVGCPQLPYRVTNYYTVAADQFRESLYADGPSYWRFTVYTDFQPWYNTAPSGDVYVNQPGTTEEAGHAVLLIGWDDVKGAYLCKNSWGATSGPQGDGTFWIAYAGHANNLGFGMANFDVVSLNLPPVADANGPYSGDEGSPVPFDGTGSSDPDGDLLTYEWDFGDGLTGTGVTLTHTFDDNAVYTVCLTVSDPWGASDEDCTTADIANVPPTATFNYPTDVDEGSTFELSLTDPYDPSNADTAAGFEYDFDCGAGYDGWDGTSSVMCQTYDDGILDVAGKIRDKDDGVTEYIAQVTVVNGAPIVSVDIYSQTIQYSDYICTVTFTATDVAADILTATPDWLPDTLSLVAQGCELSGDGIWQTCTWTVEGTIDEPQGTYVITVTVADEDGGSADADTTIIVEPEDAAIWLDPDNPVTVPVDTPGGDSPQFTLTAYVQEVTPDQTDCGADPGDIGDARVSMSLVPVGPGTSITVLCTNVDVSGTGYDAVLTADCEFDGVPVNTYYVQATVVGGYYTSGMVEGLLVIYDPSLGFTTGGGWFYWPGTTEKTTFGYTIKYLRNGNRIQGNLLLIRRLPDGSMYRVKSYAPIGLSIGEFVAGGPVVAGSRFGAGIDRVAPGDTVGWASFVGKATYQEPGWTEPVGNYRFVVYVEDRSEPGAGHDRFWFELRHGEGVLVPVMSMTRPAVDNTITLGGGNITVPHTPH